MMVRTDEIQRFLNAGYEKREPGAKYFFSIAPGPHSLILYAEGLALREAITLSIIPYNCLGSGKNLVAFDIFFNLCNSFV